MKTRLLLYISLFLCISINATSPSIGGYTVYYGHLHNHTIYSDGGGTPAQAYSYAKNKAKLDFFGISDHDTYLDSLKWSDTKAQADIYNQDGVFSTFMGFEWSYFAGYGHVTVIGTPDYTTYVVTNTFDKLKTWLSNRTGIAFFNHPGREDTNNVEFNHFNGTPSNKFVGIELWNKTEGFSSFYYNDGYAANDNSKSYYDEALNSGWKIGASGSGDDHNATWGTAEDSRMAILANNLTRADLWEAMLARRFYSTMDKNLALSFKINNQEMGSTVASGTYTFQIEASDSDGEIFTNIKLYNKAHNVVQEWTPNSAIVNISSTFTTSNSDYYYVKVTEEDGGEAISSPIWIATPDTQAPTAFTATTGTVTPNSVELLLNATDNSGSINYTISYGATAINITGTSGTQKSYFISGLNPSTNYTFNITAKDDALNVATNSPVTITIKTAAPPAYTVTSSPAVVAPYTLASLTDGNSSTSWRVLSPTVSFITFKYTNAQIINKITLTSSNDNASRDPKSWIVKASNDTLAGWTILDTKTNQTFVSRELARTYSFPNITAYKYYRLHITASNYSTTSTMLGEMAFWSDIQTQVKDTNPPTAFTATSGAVTTNSVELLMNATDNSGIINYSISYGSGPTIIDISGTSATQKSYIVTGLSASTNYSFTVQAKDTSQNIAANSPIIIQAKTKDIPVAPKDTIAPTAFSATSGTITTNSVELLMNATDNSGIINYSISYGSGPTIINISGTTATQKSYIVTGLNPSTNYSFTVQAKDTAQNMAANSPIIIQAKTKDIPVAPKDTIAPTAFSATSGTITTNSVELLMNATDNSGIINYSISYGSGPTIINISGTTATQKSYIVTGLNPSTNYSFSVQAKDTAQNIAANSPIIIQAKTKDIPAAPKDTIAPTAFSATSGTITTNSVELLMNATDNSGIINYSISYGSGPTIINISGTSATQKSYIVTGLNPSTNYSFSVQAKDTAQNIAANSPIIIQAKTKDIPVAPKDTIAPTAFSATSGTITTNSVELLMNATDNSGIINYSISYGSGPTIINISGTTATQKSYIVTGLNPSTNYSFTVQAKDTSQNIAANSPIIINIKTASAPAFTVKSSPAVVSPYSLAYLTDRNTATSWRALTPSASYITFEYANAQIINKVTLTSSTDNASRDPKNWFVKAANDTLAGWIILDSKTNQTFATRELAKTYTFANTTAYKFYRLHITASNYSTTSTMLGEMAFGTDIDTIAPTAFTAISGSITQNSVELLLNATDNSGVVNYTISYGSGPTIINVSGISATQKSFIITGLTPSTSYTFAVTAKDAALNSAANNPVNILATTTAIPAYTVISSPAVLAPYSLAYLTDGNSATSWRSLSPTTSYITFIYTSTQIVNKVTLTSSTDNALRDPKSWFVKASNDTIAGWTTLDSRTNQTFATRELAKTYSFTNNTAYKYYRLHITASNYSTTSTMLGEMAFGANAAFAPANVKQNPFENAENKNSESDFEQTNQAKKRFNVYSSNRTLFVQNPTAKAGELYLYSIYGRLILRQTFEPNSITSVQLNLPAGAYLAVGVSLTEKTVKHVVIP
ncbi:MAG: fibronectin type III domain-containing protein [Paludibacter sp.]